MMNEVVLIVIQFGLRVLVEYSYLRQLREKYLPNEIEVLIDIVNAL